MLAAGSRSSQITSVKILLPALLLAMPASTPVDDFRHGLGKWRVEAQVPSRVTTRRGVLEMDGREGITVWLRRPLTAPVRIRFEAKAVAHGGPNDSVSDLNAFWMAHEIDGAMPRSRDGTFGAYDTLQTYYVGIGGNRNSSTRMRRYVGRAGDRPLLPEHDRSDPAVLLRPNRWTRIDLIADGRRAFVVRDGCVLFALDDDEPYRSGWFGFRTTRSHLAVRNVRIDAQVDVSHTPHCPAPPPSPGRAGAPAAIPAAAAP